MNKATRATRVRGGHPACVSLARRYRKRSMRSSPDYNRPNPGTTCLSKGARHPERSEGSMHFRANSKTISPPRAPSTPRRTQQQVSLALLCVLGGRCFSKFSRSPSSSFRIAAVLPKTLTITVLAVSCLAQEPQTHAPPVKVNVLNVYTPSADEQKEIAAALSHVPKQPLFSPDFEVARA